MNHPVLRPFAWLLFGALLLWLGTVSAVWNLLALPLHALLPPATGRHLGRRVISGVYRTFWRMARACGLLHVDAQALDALRDEPGGLIVVANHPSLLDALLIVGRLPRGVCVMKASLMRNLFLGPGARLARYITNDSPRAIVRQSVAELQGGGQLVLFPEGTRTVRPPVNEFRPGFALIARHAGVPVQTVFIDTDSPYLGKGWPLWRLPVLPVRMRLRLGRRFHATGDPHRLVADLQAYFESEMAAPAAAPVAAAPVPRAREAREDCEDRGEPVAGGRVPE